MYSTVVMEYQIVNTAQKMKFSIKDFFHKCDQIRIFLWIWSHLLKKSLKENFIFLYNECVSLKQKMKDSEAYLGSCQAPMMEFFSKIVKGFYPLTTLHKK